MLASTSPVLLGVLLALPPCPEGPPELPPTRSKRLLEDVALAASGSLAVALAKPDIRRALLHDARLSNVLERPS